MYDVIVVAGGSGRRLGGVDKLALDVGGQPMLDSVLAAAGAGRTLVVVGPERPVADPGTAAVVHWTRESPPGTGPLAAVAAGLPMGSADLVVVLAGDMPLVDGSVVRRLVRSVAAEEDGAVLVDASGRPQPLAAAYRRAALEAAFARIGDPRDRPVRLLMDTMRLATVTDPRAALDCDTPDDLDRVRRTAAEGRREKG